MIKYLIITNHSYMLWQFRRELIEALLKNGEVVISTPFVGHEHDFEHLGCRCIETKMERRGKNPLGELLLLRTYRRILKLEKPDLVITYSIKPNLYAGLLCRQMDIPYCANVQGLGTAFQSRNMAFLASVMYRMSLRGARAVFFENRENAALFADKRIVAGDKITLLSGAGVNLKQYPVCPYPSEKGGIRFLYLGRIMREKGMVEFFSAAAHLKKKFGNRVQFDVVGFFDDDYQETVDRLSKEGVIRFHGFQEDPAPWYAAAHCVVLPSWHEGMSNVLLEAAATGRALICSDIPGCREAVADGETGILTKARDRKSLYRAMKAFLALTTEERKAMGVRGRIKMEQEFDRSKVVDQVLSSLNT